MITPFALSPTFLKLEKDTLLLTVVTALGFQTTHQSFREYLLKQKSALGGHKPNIGVYSLYAVSVRKLLINWMLTSISMEVPLSIGE
jgi:hypothetical protein